MAVKASTPTQTHTPMIIRCLKGLSSKCKRSSRQHRGSGLNKVSSQSLSGLSADESTTADTVSTCTTETSVANLQLGELPCCTAAPREQKVCDQVQTAQLRAMAAQQERYRPSGPVCLAHQLNDLESCKNNAHDCSAFDKEKVEKWRSRACHWCFEVVDSMRYQRELVAVALSYMDRYMSKRGTEGLTASEYRLTAMTSLYLAIKIYRAEMIGIAMFTDLCSDVEPEDVERTERDLLHKLNWNLHPPTSVAFARLIIDLLHSANFFKTRRLRDQVALHAYFMTELTMPDYSFAPHEPVNIAMSAVLIALERYSSRICTVEAFKGEDWKDVVIGTCGGAINCIDHAAIDQLKERLLYICVRDGHDDDDDLGGVDSD
eukprot:CAMPEP_0196818560 /NCGR_PEP_ID=MMETSP1362-20130617/66224_1 /TAXON_ID=163516 /ORGANISM="Leptocylindrus danicus, Strain CCMP1856" /LENGTH=374 /DNA_ID=CAMNT_0042196707 /DNA_START=125 /DNA_END=1249 /DNA_ORIENTATION=-